jgi:hypothetical protein
VIIITETGDCNRSAAQFARMIFGKTLHTVPSWNAPRISRTLRSFSARTYLRSRVAVSCFLDATCLVDKFDAVKNWFFEASISEDRNVRAHGKDIVKDALKDKVRELIQEKTRPRISRIMPDLKAQNQ